MSGEEFKARLRLLGRTQAAFADELGVSKRTVNYWSNSGPPSEIALTLDLLTRIEMPFGPFMTDDSRKVFNEKAVIEKLEELFSVARSINSSQEFVHAAKTWIRSKEVQKSKDSP